MKIIVAGGSGFIGKALIQNLLAQKHTVVLLTRSQKANQPPARGAVHVAQWDGENLGKWTEQLEGADAVVNLSGESIAAKRWTAPQKRKIVESRIRTTRAIVKAISQTKAKPKLLINASAIGFYGNVEQGDVTESHPKGKGFLAETCSQWEEEAIKAETAGIRVIRLRIGVVLEKGGGALARMLPPFRFFMGGPLGSGKQWFPWIHREDLVGLIIFLVTHPSAAGAVNATAPNPVTMKELCQTLGNVMRRPSWAPVPAFVLKVLLGEMAENMLLTGQKVVPAKATDLGFPFKYPVLRDALEDILKRP